MQTQLVLILEEGILKKLFGEKGLGRGGGYIDSMTLIN